LSSRLRIDPRKAPMFNTFDVYANSNRINHNRVRDRNEEVAEHKYQADLDFQYYLKIKNKLKDAIQESTKTMDQQLLTLYQIVVDRICEGLPALESISMEREMIIEYHEKLEKTLTEEANSRIMGHKIIRAKQNIIDFETEIKLDQEAKLASAEALRVSQIRYNFEKADFDELAQIEADAQLARDLSRDLNA
jgi:hypothetical protein